MTGKSLRRKLRWNLGDEVIPSRDPSAIVRTYIYLYWLGPTLVLASLLFPGHPDRSEPVLLGVCAAAYVVCAALLIVFDRLPSRILPALSPLGTVMISILVAAGDPGSLLYATFYFWSVLSTASLFSARATILNIAWVGFCYATVLVLSGTPEAGQNSLMVIATLSVIAAVLLVLRRKLEVLRDRSRKQARVAELGQFALAEGDVKKLSSLSAEAAIDELGALRAAVFSCAEDRSELLVKASAGFEGPTELPRLARDHPLAAAALDGSGAVQVGDDLAIAIRRRGGRAGLLVAFGRRHHSFQPNDTAFLGALARVIGEATEHHRLALEREHLALHDHLTGRPNRTLFTERLLEALDRCRRGGSQLAVYFLDLDDFKQVNDNFGHRRGDEVLKAVGPRLREGLVMTDTVARFGGDEFAILCEDVVSESQAIEVASRLRAALCEPFDIDGVEHEISASVGIVLSSGEADPEELIADADAAMYRAKERARGGFEFFDSSLRQRVLQRLEYESALREAPELGQLSLAVQPIVALPDGEPVGAEALLRWSHPELGEVPPSEFIPVAEQTGTILELGEWVLHEAFTLAALWRSDERRRYLPLQVNLSPRQLAQPNFAGLVDREFEITGARRRDLGFEITEHTLISDDPGCVEALEHLQQAGSQIVLDDFGTGYSSLSHLKRFPIDVIKVDRNFIAGLAHEGRDEVIVSAVVGMADAFALDVVAEGIETPEQAMLLAELGCRYGQGYWFSKPVPAAEMDVSLSLRGARRSGGPQARSGEPAPAPAPQPDSEPESPTASRASSSEE